MLGVFGNKKKKKMEEKTEESISRGKLKLTKEMPYTERELPISVPQAKLIRNKNNIMDFDIEYTPDASSFWYGGKYLFSFHFPDDYPISGPKVMCKTKIYHPNIDYDGNVCLNMLKDDWTPAYTVVSCAAGVYYLFVEPNPNDPLNHEVAKIMRENKDQFKENVKTTLKGGFLFGQQFPYF